MGRPTIEDLVNETQDDDNEEEEKDPWAPEEQCQGCPNHKDGPHKLGCSIHGVNQLVIPIIILE